MRRLIAIILSFLLLFCLAGCGYGPSTWQEQYNLGTRYLSEGNYEEAIIAFSAAIGIDPKQPEAYIGMADAYIGIDDYDKAAETIQQGIQACGDTGAFEEMLSKLTAARDGEGTIQDGKGALSQANADSAMQNDEEETAITLNAYGTTQFEIRNNYIDFSEMTSEQKQLIETAGNAAITNNTDALYTILDTVSTNPYPYANVYTIWNDYKVKFEITPYFDYGPGNGMGGSIYVILRPRNGLGYFFEVHFSQYYADDTRGYEETRYSCSCADWQWSGTLEGVNVRRFMFSDSTEELHTISQTGSMRESLREGTFTTMYSDKVPGLSDRSYTNVKVYQNGDLVEENGEAPQVSERKVSINGAVLDADPDSIFYVFYFDELYW